MTAGDLLNTVFLTFIAAGLGSLFWMRLNRLEEKIDTRASIADLNTLRREFKDDIAELKGDIAELRAELKGDIAELRAELKVDIGDVRRELAGVRSDVTQVALAIEPRPPQAPRASEG